MTRVAWFSLYVSVIIHVCILFGLSMCTSARSGGMGDAPDGDVAKSKSDGVHVTIIDHMPPGSTAPKEECKRFFGGIGITYDGSLISQIFKGYPAEQLRLQVGDLIPQMGTLIGEVGSDLEFDVMRGSTVTHYKIKRAKICIEE